MEYELLKFFATHPGKVFTREQLLSRVWGYEYYGGARTVDVHVRRLRAKLGEEHANLIQTVRSVGYRFGQTRLLPARRAPSPSRRDRRAVGRSGGWFGVAASELRPRRESASSPTNQPNRALQIAPPNMIATGTTSTITTTKMIAPATIRACPGVAPLAP